MKAADSTVAVAAALEWHEAHEVARSALRGHPVALPAHAALETYAVLTRIPPPLDVSRVVARDYLSRAFAGPLLTLPAEEHARLLDVAAVSDLRGGAVYDALIGATARHAGATLITLDRRATRAYEAVGVEYELLA